MENEEPEEMSCTLSAVQVQRIRGALANAVTVLEGLYFNTLTDQQRKTLAIPLETADHIRQVLSELEALTADIPEGETEGEFGNE
jgi:hypothetical protein